MANSFTGRDCVRAVNGAPVFAPVPAAALSRPDHRNSRHRGSGTSSRRASVRAAAATVSSKSALRRPREENVEGDFYVDHTCIGKPEDFCRLLVTSIRACFRYILNMQE